MTDRKKNLIRQYKEREVPAGIFQVKNVSTGMVFLGSSLNIDGSLNRHRFQLSAGMHPVQSLQRDWNTYGPEKFLFEVLETVKRTDDPDFNLEEELTLLEQIWIEKLHPEGEAGYNTSTVIRQV
jgi:hypothetical protein